MSYSGWDEPTHSDPIADLREFGASVFLNRQLTDFERIVVRAGLCTGSEFAGPQDVSERARQNIRRHLDILDRLGQLPMPFRDQEDER